MNTRKKGNRNQLKAIKLLEKCGFLVSKVEQRGRFVKEKDLFGLFDICCINNDEVRFVQITSNRPHSHKKFMAFSKKYQPVSVVYQQWVWYDRCGWKIFDYPKGKKYVADMRV